MKNSTTRKWTKEDSEQVRKAHAEYDALPPAEKARMAQETTDAHAKWLEKSYHYSDGTPIPSRTGSKKPGSFIATIPAGKTVKPQPLPGAADSSHDDPEYKAALKATGLTDEDVHKLSALFPSSSNK